MRTVINVFRACFIVNPSAPLQVSLEKSMVLTRHEIGHNAAMAARSAAARQESRRARYAGR
jgi:hypothetical protein